MGLVALKGWIEMFLNLSGIKRSCVNEYSLKSIVRGRQFVHGCLLTLGVSGDLC